MNFLKKLLASAIVFFLIAAPASAAINYWKLLDGVKLAPWNGSVTDVCFDYLGTNCISASSIGDVVGPSSAVDERIAIFNGTTGNIIKDGLALLTDFALLAGRAGGQILIGGTASGDDLLFQSTSDATKGIIVLGSPTTGFIYDAVNERVSIGGDETTATVSGVSKASTFSTHITGGSQDYTWMSHVHSNSVGPVISGARSGGSEASPSIVADGYNLLDLIGLGYDGTDLEPGAAIHLDVGGTPGDDDMPGKITFFTTPDGSTTLTEALLLDSSQNATFAGDVIFPNLVLAPDVNQAITAVSNTINLAGHIEVTPDADYVMTSTPTITAGVDGQFMMLHNTSETNTIALQDDSVLSGSDIFLGGAESTIKPRSTMLLHYSTDASAVGWHVISNPNSASAGASADLIPVRNTSGSGIAAGKAVYATGYNVGQARITIDLADADGANTFPVVGFTTTAIGNNANGNIVVQGELNGVIDTSVPSAGDGVWLSTTAGAVVFTRPSADEIQRVGTVTRSNASGNIFIVGAGRVNDSPADIPAATTIGTNAIADASDVLSFFSATTSAELKTVISNETGSGLLVFGTSPVLTSPALGTPSALVGTNISGTGSSFTAGNVTTNANLTGHITSSGNAAVLGSFTTAQLSTALSDGLVCTSDSTNTWTNKTFDANGTGNSLSNVDVADLADGTDGELITWDTAGASDTVAAGTADQVLTSNGAGAAPTFQDAGGGGASTLTAIPRPLDANVEFTTTHNDNTQGWFGLVNIPGDITVNKLTVIFTTINVAGTWDIVLYAEDGQSKIIDITTASISGTGFVSTAVSAVDVSAGNYYIAFLPNGSANAIMSLWTGFTNDFDPVSGEPATSGIISGLSAGVLPATFTPSSITGTPGKSIRFRLDN